MNNEEKYTLKEAHKEFAKRTNGLVWRLLGKSDRTPDENHEMVLTAIASLYHWHQVGTEVHRQRGEWLIAHVFTVLGDSDQAIKHAQRCLTLTEAHKDQLADFDHAYAYEGFARAQALGGQGELAREYLEMAKSTSEAIVDPEDKEIFMGDLKGGDWYGVYNK
jgi:hypothetical protein